MNYPQTSSLVGPGRKMKVKDLEDDICSFMTRSFTFLSFGTHNFLNRCDEQPCEACLCLHDFWAFIFSSSPINSQLTISISS